MLRGFENFSLFICYISYPLCTTNVSTLTYHLVSRQFLYIFNMLCHLCQKDIFLADFECWYNNGILGDCAQHFRNLGTYCFVINLSGNACGIWSWRKGGWNCRMEEDRT
jgi:hypothetical protein